MTVSRRLLGQRCEPAGVLVFYLAFRSDGRIHLVSACSINLNSHRLAGNGP